MVSLASLWLPIVLSAVIVWLASALAWMALPHHKSDWKRLPDEDAFRDAVKSRDVSPGQYLLPYATDMKAMQDPETVRKYEEGPVGYLTVMPRGRPQMGKPMTLSFAYYVIMGLLVAYVAGRTLPPGTEYLRVFQITSTVAWMGYAGAVIMDAIWFGRPWSNTWKLVLDGLAYGLLTGGTFGWLWPG